ncbi:hypothetical protein [Euryhalocaulis caribicus]|uniref:hypothetical protein n=1 Tax=Euryhalocaulis caribicus TaxID=1161401 RepID=UPI0003A07A61|nr:hypothetical protein [Euryhalocaulis caribicus]
MHEPPTDDELDLLLLEIKALCMPRRGMDDDIDVILNAFNRRLKEYPRGDVVHVLRRWPDQSRYWPTWSELREKLETRIEARRPVRYDPPPEREPLSDEELAERKRQADRLRETVRGIGKGGAA